MEKFEQLRNLEQTISQFEDLRSLDLSKSDLRNIAREVLIATDFDTATIWPKKEKLPDNFDPKNIIESAKDPGLGVRKLHQQGIDGRGIKVAIIDQSLSSENGEIMQHEEYVSSIVDYKEYGEANNEGVSMHGPGVTSLFIGKECGVAPGSELVYRAVPGGRDFHYYADALLDIIAYNKLLHPSERVKIVSCSIGYYNGGSPELGMDRWFEAIKDAEEEGIIVSDVSSRTGVNYTGGGASDDKDDIDNYRKALFLERDEVRNKELYKIFLETDDVEMILKRIRGINKDKFDDISDHLLRDKILETLKTMKDEIIIPCDYRTMASMIGPREYMYNGRAGMSWAVPYFSGLLAMALQVSPGITKEEMANAMSRTVRINKNGLKVVSPKDFIDSLRNNISS